MQVVQAINSDSPCNSKYRHIVEDIKAGMRNLSSASFNHARRTATTAAHEPAVEARTHVIDTIRWNALPPSIYGIIRREESLPSF
jgi:hypothetical protein